MKKLFLSVLALLAFAASGTAQTLPSYVPANGLVGWWPFNGNANDESGNGNNGTVNGATLVADRFGNAGKAYRYNGTTDFTKIQNVSVFQNNSISVSFWVKLSGLNNYDSQELFSKGIDSQNGLNINFWNSDGNIYSSFGANNTNAVFGGFYLLPHTSWHHVVFTFDNNIMKLYDDGVLVSTKTHSTPSSVNLSNGDFFLGKHNMNCCPYYTNGNLDDLAIWNRVLTQQEVTGLYDGSNTISNCPTLLTNLQQGLVGYWPFCGNALDESGNGNHGTVNGATLTADRFGNPDKAYSFDGNDWIEVLNNSFFNNMSNYSISIWIKKNQGVLRQEVVSKDSDPQPTGDWSMYIENNLFKTEILANNTSQTIYCNSINTINDHIWEHYILTRNISDGTLILFRNGVSENISVGPSTNIQNNSNIFFGKHSIVNLFFKGSLDDIAIWNRALTPQEIQQVYNQGICQTSITVTDTLLIHTGITSYNPVAYGNTLKVWPNPTNNAITLDAGNLSSMQGWKYKVANTLGQTVVNETAINQQQTNISLSTWGGNGIYYLHLINPQGHAIEIKKIVLAP